MRILPRDEHEQGAGDSQSDADALKALSQIEGSIVRSLKLGATVRDNDDSRGSYDTVTAVWCQSRLLMHRSACKVKYYSRQSAMSANLTEALDWLNSVLRARITAGRASDDKVCVDDKARMDDKVYRVVTRIRSKTTAIAEAIIPVGAGV